MVKTRSAMELSNFDNFIDKVDSLDIKTKHFSWIYNTDNQSDSVSIPLIAHNLANMKFCLVTVSDQNQNRIIEKLVAMDIDVEKYISTDQLRFVKPESFLLQDGEIDKDVIIERFQSTIDESAKQEWRGVLVVNDSSQLLKDIDIPLFLYIENRLDQKCADNPCTLLCLFDDRLVSGSLVAAVIKVHPAVGLGDDIVRNPFYVGPFTKQDYPA